LTTALYKKDLQIDIDNFINNISKKETESDLKLQKKLWFLKLVDKTAIF